MFHAIVWVQPTKGPEGRGSTDYESVNKCLEEFVKYMKSIWNSPSIPYDISQLFAFLDDLADLSCPIYTGDTQTYQPYNKDWIKEIYLLLCEQAKQAGK